MGSGCLFPKRYAGENVQTLQDIDYATLSDINRCSVVSVLEETELCMVRYHIYFCRFQ